MHYKDPVDRHQQGFFTTLDDFVPADHPVRVLDAVVDTMVAQHPDQFQYKGQACVGQKAYSPATHHKLLLYGYLHGITSSRKLEVETQRNLEVKWLLGDLQPDFKTIADFRKDNGDQIAFVAQTFRQLLHRAGYITGEQVALDGTKVKANAKRQVHTAQKLADRLEQIDASLTEYCAQLTAQDCRDTQDAIAALAPDATDQELVDLIAQLEAQRAQLQAAQTLVAEAQTPQVSPTDPEARVMQTAQGKVPAYNVQAMVDAKHQFIAGATVHPNANDMEALAPMVAAFPALYGHQIGEVLADTGYYNPADIQTVEATGVHCVIPPTQSPKATAPIDFAYDAQADEYRCSAGQRLVLKHQNKKQRKRVADLYQGISCGMCPRRAECTTSKHGRTVLRYHDEDWVNAYHQRMRTRPAKAKSRHRAQLVEHVFGTLKYWMGQLPLLLRGEEKVQTEIDLYTTAYNLKRLITLEGVDVLLWKMEQGMWARS